MSKISTKSQQDSFRKCEIPFASQDLFDDSVLEEPAISDSDLSFLNRNLIQIVPASNTGFDSYSESPGYCIGFCGSLFPDLTTNSPMLFDSDLDVVPFLRDSPVLLASFVFDTLNHLNSINYETSSSSPQREEVPLSSSSQES